MRADPYRELTPAQRLLMHRYDDVSKDRRQSWTTQKAYRAQIVNYLCWRTRNRERLEGLPTERKVELFLLKRTTHDRVGPVARKQSFCALLFLYRYVLKQPIGEIGKLGARPQVKHALPAAPRPALALPFPIA